MSQPSASDRVSNDQFSEEFPIYIKAAAKSETRTDNEVAADHSSEVALGRAHWVSGSISTRALVGRKRVL